MDDVGNHGPADTTSASATAPISSAPAAPALPGEMRLMIVSTPRTGNTWLRALVVAAYNLWEDASHHPGDVDWAHLPPRFAVQLHWPPTPEFVDQLAAMRCRPVTISRHPLDVLLSILHYVQRPGWSQSSRWLTGSGGNEASIQDCLPNSEAFLAYAVGARARALLDVTCRWWTFPGIVRLRYEDLVEDTRGALEGVSRQLGEPLPANATVAIEANSRELLRGRSLHHQHHVWQGRPGLWRSLLPAAAARQIYEAHRAVFTTLGYTCDPDESLTPADADATWYKLEMEKNRHDTERLWKQLGDAEGAVAAMSTWQWEMEQLRAQAATAKSIADLAQAALESTRANLAAQQTLHQTALQAAQHSAQAELAAAQTELARAREELAAARGELARFAELGERSLKLARAAHRLGSNWPRATKPFRFLISKL